VSRTTHPHCFFSLSLFCFEKSNLFIYSTSLSPTVAEISLPFSLRTEEKRNLTNVVVEWWTLPLLIPEVPGLNFGPETGYPYWAFSWLSSVPPDKCLDSALN
jgi:hypothetical protein